jgi:hypothetical protein
MKEGVRIKGQRLDPHPPDSESLEHSLLHQHSIVE